MDEVIDLILDSWINGQKHQAYEQYKASGYDSIGFLNECRHKRDELELLNMFAFFLFKEEGKQ